MPSQELDLVRGTFDLIILKTLSWGPMHGLGVLRWIEDVTRHKLQVEEGALYPALHRLEQQGLIAGEWTESADKRRVKSYVLTPSGRKRLSSEKASWKRIVTAMSQLLEST